MLALALRIEPGDPTFYVATFALAVVWATGALVSGPLHLGRGHTRAGRGSSRAIVQSLALGFLLLGVFMLGSVVVARIPVLREPVQELLDHARFGSLALVGAHHDGQRDRRGAVLPRAPCTPGWGGATRWP